MPLLDSRAMWAIQKFSLLMKVKTCDELVIGCESMELNFEDLKYQLDVDSSIEFNTCPVDGHNMHGKVERKIREIKKSIIKVADKERLSVIQWETLASELANCINNLPLALGSTISDLENLDLLTPNRLRLGRNNDRIPVGPLYVTNKPDSFIKLNQQIFNAWFECWLISHVPKLMHQPKWFKDDYDISVGDIVLFLKHEGHLAGKYQYGKIKSVQKGTDGKVRTVNVEYRNHTENANRTTRRSVRQLVMIHPVDELSLSVELGEIATLADMKHALQFQCSH